MNNIEISNLSKTYKGGVVALENITFTIGRAVYLAFWGTMVREKQP